MDTLSCIGPLVKYGYLDYGWGMHTATTTTKLGAAIRARRGKSGQIATASDIGIPQATLSRIEAGRTMPAIDTALALAKWLGWHIDEVYAAAKTRVSLGTDHATCRGTT